MPSLRNVNRAYKRIIVRLSLVTLFAAFVILPFPTSSPLPVLEVEAQSCSVPTTTMFGSTTYYNWTANGSPSSDSCWSHSSAAAFVTGTTECGQLSPPTNAWEFYFGGSISQTFTIPSNRIETNFSIQYDVDFIDPNNDPAWNRFTMSVRDLTTSTQLASDYYDGSMADLSCSLRSRTWTQNLAGHQIQVTFQGSRGYSDTFIRVRNIAQFQH